jgi:Coenzyme PQQ synthesis protein D (PqqD)
MSNMQSEISGNSIVRAAEEQVSADLDGEAVILNLQNGVYYGLDPVGAFIWNLLKEPVKVDGIRDAILEEYDVEPDQCERDLLDLLGKLRSEGLIEVSNE